MLTQSTARASGDDLGTAAQPGDHEVAGARGKVDIIESTRDDHVSCERGEAPRGDKPMTPPPVAPIAKASESRNRRVGTSEGFQIPSRRYELGIDHSCSSTGRSAARLRVSRRDVHRAASIEDPVRSGALSSAEIGWMCRRGTRPRVSPISCRSRVAAPSPARGPDGLEIPTQGRGVSDVEAAVARTQSWSSRIPSCRWCW